MENGNQIRIETPIGTLIGYVCPDPNNPGIFIDLMPTGKECMISMSGTECQIGEEAGETTLVTHVWADRRTEDTTHSIEHIF